MAAHTVIPKQTDAVTTPVVVGLEILQTIPATIVAVGLAGVETATISFSEDGGTTSTPASQSGSPVVLTATNNIIEISSPVTLTVVKSATAAPAGVFLYSALKQIS